MMSPLRGWVIIPDDGEVWVFLVQHRSIQYRKRREGPSTLADIFDGFRLSAFVVCDAGKKSKMTKAPITAPNNKSDILDRSAIANSYSPKAAIINTTTFHSA